MLEDLKAKALAASAVQWVSPLPDSGVDREVNLITDLVAAANPAAVLELIERLEKAEAIVRLVKSQAPAVMISGKKIAWNHEYSGPYEGHFYALPVPAQRPTDTAPIPQNADQAAGMVLIGTAWLKKHAPERLEAGAAITSAGNAKA